MTIASPTNPSSASASPASAERCNGRVDSFEHSNCTIQVHWSDDTDMGPPWKEHDGHGVVEVVHQRDSDYTPESEQNSPFQRLSPWGFNANDWYYNFPASLDLARKEYWGLAPDALDKLQFERGRSLTDDEITEAAVQADFEHLRAWCHDEWRWMVADVIVNVRSREGSCFLKVVSCLGGIESTGAADELEELLAPARDWIDENQERINQIARSHELICCTRRQLTEP